MKPAEPFRMTPVYDLLLRGDERTPVGLYQLQLATAEQLCRLHYSPGSIKAVQARLKTLVDHGYAQADCVPTKKTRSPYYYMLGTHGMNYLEAMGYDTHLAWRASKEGDKHGLFLDHTLEVNDILIAAALLGRERPNYRLEKFMHERVLKRSPYKAKWHSNGHTDSFTIIPDAFLEFRLTLVDGTQHRMPLLLEHDRGTEEQAHFRRRIRAYAALLKSEAYKELFGVRTLTVAFTTFVGEARLEQMRVWTRQELDSTKEPMVLGMTFCFAALQRPLLPEAVWLSPCWYTPYDTPNQPIALLAA